MNWFHDFEDELALVFEEAERLISAFPDPLNRFGRNYLTKFNVMKEGSAKNYVCYLLPYWLNRPIRLPDEICRRLSLANVFGMLYFFVQDDVMDSSDPPGHEQLPMANLFYLELLTLYRTLFPSDSPVWDYFSLYVKEWAESTANENSRNYFLENHAMVARKAGPVKLSGAAVLLLSGQAERIPVVSEMIDLQLITLQMLDDWADWEEDLAVGSYNGLLALIRSRRGDSPDIPLIDPAAVRTSLYVHGCFSDYAKIAVVNHRRMTVLGFDAPYVLAFHRSMVRNLLQEASRIKRERKLLELGGLYYYLSKFKKQ